MKRLLTPTSRGPVLPTWQPLCGAAVDMFERTNRAGIKLTYIWEAMLRDAELQQVLALARLGGIQDVGEVNTYQSPSSVEKGITVHSRHRVEDRNISYDTLPIHKIGWSSAKPPEDATRTGVFWMNPSSKYTTLQRAYQLEGATRYVVLGRGIVGAFADKIVPLIAARQVRFKDESVQKEFDAVDVLKPDSFESRSHEGYEMHFRESMKTLRFRYENGEVTVTAVGAQGI